MCMSTPRVVSAVRERLMQNAALYSAIGRARVVISLLTLSVVGAASAVTANGTAVPNISIASAASFCPTTTVFGSPEVTYRVTGKPQSFVVGQDVNCVRIA